MVAVDNRTMVASVLHNVMVVFSEIGECKLFLNANHSHFSQLVKSNATMLAAWIR